MKRQKISRKEGKLIKKVIKEKGYTPKEVSKHLGFSHNYMSQLIRVGFRLNPNVAEKLYSFLGKDSRVDFLKRYQMGSSEEISIDEYGEIHGIKDQPKSQKEPESATPIWMKLYDIYTSKIQMIYSSETPDVKGKILGDLERLLMKCNLYKTK